MDFGNKISAEDVGMFSDSSRGETGRDLGVTTEVQVNGLIMFGVQISFKNTNTVFSSWNCMP